MIRAKRGESTSVNRVPNQNRNVLNRAVPEGLFKTVASVFRVTKKTRTFRWPLKWKGGYQFCGGRRESLWVTQSPGGRLNVWKLLSQARGRRERLTDNQKDGPYYIGQPQSTKNRNKGNQAKTGKTTSRQRRREKKREFACGVGPGRCCGVLVGVKKVRTKRGTAGRGTKGTKNAHN